MIFIWRIQQALHIGLWTILIYRGLEFQGMDGWTGLAVFMVFQLAQFLFVSAGIGEEHNFSKGQSMVMTLLFGYSWWMPLRKKPKSQ